MSPTHHRNWSKLFGHLIQFCLEWTKTDMHYFLAGFVNHQSIGKVIDILRGTGKVNKFLIFWKFTVLLKFFFQEVFNCFYIMICSGLNCLDSLSIFNREILKNLVEVLLLFDYILNIFHALCSDLLLKKKLEPFKFNKYPVLHQCILRKELSQVVRLSGVSSIDRRNRCKFSHFSYLCSKLLLLSNRRYRFHSIFLNKKESLIV